MSKSKWLATVEKKNTHTHSIRITCKLLKLENSRKDLGCNLLGYDTV
jgi:hypothetical protein